MATVTRHTALRPVDLRCTSMMSANTLARTAACSASCATCVGPSFIFVTFASGSCGFVQSVFDVLFLRFRSSRASASRVGVLMPEVSASRVKNP